MKRCNYGRCWNNTLRLVLLNSLLLLFVVLLVPRATKATVSVTICSLHPRNQHIWPLSRYDDQYTLPSPLKVLLVTAPLAPHTRHPQRHIARPHPAMGGGSVECGESQNGTSQIT